MIYLVDRHYMIVAKLVSLLVDEHLYARLGIDIEGAGIGRQIACTIANDGPRGIGPEPFDTLLATAAMFFSKKNRDGDQVTVDQLFAALRTAATKASRRKNPALRALANIMQLLVATRGHAEAFLADRGEVIGSSTLPLVVLHEDDMEPLIPSVVALGTEATERFGRLHILTDDQRLFTDSNLDYVDAGIKAMIARQGLHANALRGELRRGKSTAHPSLQLADLVAGAGSAVARRHIGESSPAGDDLYAAAVPLITEGSLLPYGDPAAIAEVNSSSSGRR